MNLSVGISNVLMSIAFRLLGMPLPRKSGLLRQTTFGYMRFTLRVLNHSAFASIEFHPVEFYREIHKKGLYSDFYVGCNIDPAVMGAEKGNPFYKACLDHYQTLKFENTPKALESLIMPRVISRIAARNFGFKFCPAYQKLDGDFCIYPSDVFSGSLEDSEIRHSLHLGANTWGYKSEASGLKQRVRALAIRFLKKYFPKIFAYVKGKRVA